MPLNILKLFFKHRYLIFILAFTLSGLNAQVIDRTIVSLDTTIKKTGFNPVWRWKDSYLNRFSVDLPHSPLINIFPDSLRSTVLYAPSDQQIETNDKLGQNQEYKLSQRMSFNEYSSLQNAAIRQSIIRDYERLMDGNSSTSGRGLSPKLQKNPIVDRIFGGKPPEFKPNGFVSVDIRAGSQYINNPFLPLFQRKRPIFDFDQQISINFNNLFNGSGGQDNGYNGNTGNTSRDKNNSSNDIRQLGRTLGNVMGAGNQARQKMNILGNMDTKSAFNFENQFKLNFKNEPEDILQTLELGNVSFPVRSQLVPGVENLFGLKAGMRFGKLDVTSVFAQQRSRTQSVIINGGAQSRPFEIRCDEYDENRHFFLSHFFRDKYEGALKNMPMITSGVMITRIEVYVTNRTNTVNTMRNVVGITDLGEKSPFNTTAVTVNNEIAAASNLSNSIGTDIVQNTDPNYRKIDNINTSFETIGLNKGIDFEILRGAKKLTEREFNFHPQLGYLSLLTPLRNDEILAVAYEYTYNGRSYKVGELTEDYAARKEDDVIMLKMLKSSTIRNRLFHPMWDLMMKNVYSLNMTQVERQGFQLRIIYKDDKTGIDVPNLHEGVNLKDKNLLTVFKMDRLNFNNDPQPDGNIDFIENITIDPAQGKVIFPVLEPFGSYLSNQFETSEEILKEKYVFQQLYDKTLTDAQQVNTKNKFFIKGNVQSSSSEIPLPLGASGNSVRIYAGGTELQQGADYSIDNQLGRIKITNPSILASARQIRIDYETPDLFQAQIRRLFGTRMDYTISRDIRVGGTFMSLRENTPGFLTRASIGNEPVNNTLWGLDLNLKKEGIGFTRMLDKLPLIQTKEPSSVILSAEFAQLIPGVNNRRVNGNAMIDDFEAARNINDLTRQPNRWKLGSTPAPFKDSTDSPYGYNYRRAKISAYTIDPSTFFNSSFGGAGSVVPEALQQAAQSNLYERSFQIQDIFPGRSRPVLGQNLPTNILDISYFPNERGMYNYNPDLSNDGLLNKPKENFGAIMRGITFDADFDNSNVEYLEFWLLDPFKDKVNDGIFNRTNDSGGKLIFQLGDISEDVIPDSRFNFENGILPVEKSTSIPDSTAWGRAPTVQYITDAFDNSEDSRSVQDIGLDGLSNSQERTYQHIDSFLDKIRPKLTPQAYNQIEIDPSADDFRFFLDQDFTDDDFIVKRFKDNLGMENNAPPINQNDLVTPASTATADKEDINADNSINDTEGYHEYTIDIKPSEILENKYIIDKVAVPNRENTFWYLYRIPIRNPDKSIDVEGFKSIRFMRMLLTGWEESVVLRFAALQLVANQYRTYTQDLNDHTYQEIPEKYDAGFKVSTVSVEENGCDQNGNCNIKEGQIPYVVPPGFRRDRDFSQQTLMEFNEQSASLSVDRLQPNDKRAIFKNTKIDLNMYKRLQMFVHMHADVPDTKGGAFLRFGTDLKNNYYEVEINQLTQSLLKSGSTQNDLQYLAEEIWPYENDFDIPLDSLRNLKVLRNRTAFNLDSVYSKSMSFLGENALGEMQERKYTIRVIGNPDLSNIQTFMMGVSNPEGNTRDERFTVWFDELRANGFDQTKGEAGVLSADIKLADIATVSLSGNLNTFGFGGVQSRISERSRSTAQGFGIASAIQVDKLFPEKWGLSIPFFINYDRQDFVPHFDPLDPDVVLENSLTQFNNVNDRNRYRQSVIESSVNKGFNFSNVRKIKTDPKAKSNIYDIENFTFSYAHTSIERKNAIMKEYLHDQQRGGLTYQYSPKGINWEPFKNNKKFDKQSLLWLKDFNLSPLPSLIAFRSDFDKSYIKTQFISSKLDTAGIEPYYQQYFLLNRFYDLQWDLTKSLDLSYSAHMNAIVDHANGELDSPVIKNEIWDNLKSMGRPKDFIQNVQANYKLPLDKFFLLDWLRADARVNTDFHYRANAFDYLNQSIITDENNANFGNFAENNREVAIQGAFDLIKLYNKLKYLKFANSPNAPRERFTRAFGDDEDVMSSSSEVLKKFTRLLMTVRGINFNYSISQQTILPGIIAQPKFLGNLKAMSGTAGGDMNWLPFTLFGSQGNYINDTTNSWLYNANQNGLMSPSIIRNDPFTQNRQKRFDFSTNLEPWTGLRMQIKGNYSKGDSYQEIFRPDAVGSGQFQSYNPFRNGTFSMSFWSFKTGFKKMSKDPGTNYQYEIFDNMVAYRQLVLDKLNLTTTGGENGNYDINSQDVLIPAFFAAYSGKSVDDLYNKAQKKGRETFNPFLSFPLPNWRIDYNGLEKLPVFRKLFSSLTLNHSYSSTYSVGNFTSSLIYGAGMVNLGQNDYLLGTAAQNFGTNPNFIPVFVMSTITMEEKYAPMIGVQFSTKGKLSGQFAYNKERRASLNLSNAQVAEYNSNDLVFGMGFRKNNVKMPFKGRDGNFIVLKNDLNFRFDITLRDITALQRRLDGDAVPIQGNYNFQLRPQVQYQFNKRLSMSFYIEHFNNSPFTSLSYQTKRTVGGLNMKFNLAE